MATYLQIYNLRYESATIRPRVEVAVVKSAQYILIENPATANHANRVKWAQWALRNSSAAAEQMMWAVLGNGDVQTNGDASTDVQIQYVVDVTVDTFADGSQS